jgi:hypothetical protein
MYIPRDKNLERGHPFQYVNACQIQISSGSFLLPNGINLNSGTNVSLNIELKPLNQSIGYVIVVKLGQSPIVNETYADYDSFKFFCPSI